MQNSPVVACRANDHAILGIRVSAELAKNEAGMATLELMLHALFPGLSSLPPQDGWNLRFSVADGFGRPVLYLTPASLNEQLHALGKDPVTAFAPGNIPFQVLVMLRFKPQKLHLEYLLSRLREYGVQAVSMAETPHLLAVNKTSVQTSKLGNLTFSRT